MSRLLLLPFLSYKEKTNKGEGKILLPTQIRLKTNVCFVFLKNLHNKFNSLPGMPFSFNLMIHSMIIKRIPLCHAFSKAFDISR